MQKLCRLPVYLLLGLIVLLFQSTRIPESNWAVGAESPDQEALVRQLEDVSGAQLQVYKLRDDRGQGMDCLKVFQPVGTSGTYYGVYHNFQAGVLVTHLARSTDLVQWTHLTALDDHASQPAIHVCDNGGYLLAYEHDEPNSVWIRLRYYDSLDHLLTARFQRQFDIERTLAPTAEGTPSFETVEIGPEGLEQSQVKLRFHYYKGGDVDQLATGTLVNFSHWQATADDELNQTLISDGWRGNLGDRDKIEWEGQVYYLQETQQTRGDWGSWRLCLCDHRGRPLRPLAIQTAQGSTAFSNPHATWVRNAAGQRMLVVTLFLHSRGNPPAERGVLLYVIAGT